MIGYLAAQKYPRLRAAMIAGAFGGFVGTIGYDLFRIPFVAAGLRLFSPIDSYGVLLLGADSSSPWTGLAGWGYHFSNGIGFGIFYGCVALGRKFWWGLLWAMLLETATIVTPFAGAYGIKGHWGLIVIAYAAHVAYGVPLGKIVESAEGLARSLSHAIPRPLMVMLVSLTLGLVIWQRPFSPSAEIRRADKVATGPSALISGGRFVPEWLRLPVGGCATLKNEDDSSYKVAAARPPVTLGPGSSRRACFAKPGVFRVRLTSEPYSGGFVIVDSMSLRALGPFLPSGT